MTWAAGYKAAQNTIMRRNKSGCCCKMDDEDNIVSICGAHQEYIEKLAPPTTSALQILDQIKTVGWMPIESAPRDMSDILVYDGNSVWISYYDTDYERFLKRDVIEDDIPSASHWMPMPKMPKEDK